MVKLSAPRTGFLYPFHILSLVLISFRGLVYPKSTVLARRIKPKKNLKDTIGNRTRNLLVSERCLNQLQYGVSQEKPVKQIIPLFILSLIGDDFLLLS
jgi:hypothetical protein